MAQNNNQNGAQTAPTTQSKAIAAMKDELANSVLRRIEELQANGGLVVPKDYAVTNQMNLAWLRISEMLWEDSNKVQHPVLEVVTKASVANSLLDMVLQGMDIQKKQGYFIPIKNKASGQLELTFWRSYFGDEKLARAQGMKKVRSVVVYEGDEFEYMYTEDGEIKITKHVPSLSRIDKDKIVAAYAVTTMADGSHSTTIKTMTYPPKRCRRSLRRRPFHARRQPKRQPPLPLKTTRSTCNPMKLHVISSSSAGNCYVLESEASALVIECGASPETMFARTGIDARKFVGAVVTHEHGDHAAHIGKYADRAIDVYASRGTLAACHIDKAYRAHALRPMQSVTVGDFVVRAFDVKHDAAEPFGYIIEHEECGKVLFATDTHFIRYNFKSLRLNHILIEANYSQEELDDNIARGAMNPAQAARVRTSHLSIDAACDMVKANETAELSTVVLLHLSNANSLADAFAAQMRKTARFARVFVADKGLIVELNKSEI